MIDKNTGEPYINVWFGNFYKPAYDDKAFVKKGIALLKDLGFNSVRVDAKAWEDFKTRCEGGPASQYVAMQEYMERELKAQGMSHEFLALYLNADNLYPNIRFSPPIYGESVVNAEGQDGKWYRYWSGKARTSMQEHVARMMARYGDNYVTVLQGGRERKPICSMWDPIVAPSFDAEGRARYLGWLQKRYGGDIAAFNRAYGATAAGFDDLQKEDYWFDCAYPAGTAFSTADALAAAPKARMLMDNRLWQRDELCDYFADMQKRLYAVDDEFYLCPDMAQWGYFLNVDGSMLSGVGFADLWDTAARGIDIYKLAPYVDCANFLSVPVTPAGDADAYVAACQHNMLRNINAGRDFVGGIYWGRFLYNDLYAVLTPCEVIGSIVASGAAGYTSYGMCGLDDGGVLHRMPPCFNESLARGNAWAKRVIPRLGALRKAEIAILFPSAMALAETMHTDGNKERRMDLLGWYKACCDLGLAVDITDGDRFAAGAQASPYRVLILPQDDCYGMDPQPALETAIRAWCRAGGTVLYGPGNALAAACFGTAAQPHAKDGFFYGEGGMVQSLRCASFAGGKTIAAYLGDGLPCVTEYPTGSGRQLAFGFDYGYAYTAKIAPHVPPEQKNNELYPLTMMKQNLLAELLAGAGLAPHDQKGIETARFADGQILINHTAYPFTVEEPGEKEYQYPAGNDLLLPHAAVFIAL